MGMTGWSVLSSSQVPVSIWFLEGGEFDRAIRIGKLNALLRFHTRPIDVVVFHGSDSET